MLFEFYKVDFENSAWLSSHCKYRYGINNLFIEITPVKLTTVRVCI